MIADFEFLITSPVNLEKLTCEIYYKGECVAIISQETNEYIIELGPSPKTKCWTFILEEFQEVLENAKNYLRG
jgi:hypothetical protein